MSQHMELERKPVERDLTRFKLLFTNSRPIMPAGHTTTFPMTSTLALIRQRLRSNQTVATTGER